jgi:hypothetical protein
VVEAALDELVVVAALEEFETAAAVIEEFVVLGLFETQTPLTSCNGLRQLRH